MRPVALTFLFAAITCGALDAWALNLEEALARTLERNPSLQQSRSALEQAAGQRLVFRAVGLPRATISGIAGIQGGQRAGEPTTQPFAFSHGSFRQFLFNAALPASYRRGDIEVLIAQQQLNIAVVTQLHKARVAFYTALYNRSLEAFGESQRTRLNENIAGEQARYEAGAVDRAALTSATLQARELDPQIEDAHRAYEGAILQLMETMGSELGPGAQLPSLDGDLEFIAVNPILESETAVALKHRADLKLARLLVRAAREEQRIAAGAYYPEIGIVGSGEYIPVSDVHGGSQGSPQRSDDIISSEIRAGPAFTWRVIDNGRVGGSVLRQRSVREINELQLRKLEQSVPLELGRLRNNFRAIAARHQSLTLAADVAEKNVVAVQGSREHGAASQLEFRTAETSLLSTRSGILSAAYQQRIALAEWDRATGRYFEFSDDTARKVH